MFKLIKNVITYFNLKYCILCKNIICYFLLINKKKFFKFNLLANINIVS